MITRRAFVRGLGALGLSGLSIGGYAIAEPWRLTVRRYALTPPRWPPGLRLRIAAIADLHCCEPWMPVSRVEQIVARTNALRPDVVLLLGDFIAGARMWKRAVPPPAWTEALARLSAPLGSYAVLGNHDWWEDREAQRRRAGPTAVARSLTAGGIPVLENTAVRLVHGGRPFWLAGLGCQWAFYWGAKRNARSRRFGFEGVDDLPATLAGIADDAPLLMMIHEPDAFADMPDRVSLTFAGHTHGGQITIAGYAPIVPSAYGRRYAYGHVVEEGRHLIVSGGLGCSGVPLRLGVPPEIVVADLGGEAAL